MDTTTLIFVIIGAFTVSSLFMRLVDYLEGEEISVYKCTECGNQFEAVENMDSYNELANAVVVLACNDYRDYKKNFRKNQDVLAYINQRLSEVEENTEQRYNLQIVQEDTERDQRLLQSKISEIEKFLHSQYGMTLSHGLGDVILEKIQNEHPTAEPSAERGYTLFKEKEKKIQERLKKLFERGKK